MNDVENNFTSANTLDFSSLALKYQCLYGIKRKDSFLRPYTKKIFQRYCLIDFSIYSKNTELLAEYLTTIDRENFYLINSQEKLQNITKLFANLLEIKHLPVNIKPGQFTNTLLPGFMNVSGIFIIHDRKEKQAVAEALTLKNKNRSNVGIVGFNNFCKGLRLYDIVIPINNFNSTALTFGFWYLYYHYCLRTDKIPVSLEDFKNLL